MKDCNYFIDLNKDSFSEKINVNTVLDGMTGIIVGTGKENKTVDQWNFFGELIDNNNPFYADIDNDGLSEFLVLTYLDNKIFLNCVNPFTGDTLIQNKFLSNYFPVADKIDCGVHFCGVWDLNKDGKNEIYFSLIATYSDYPRNMFAYDFGLDTLYKSQDACIIFEEPFAIDFENKGLLEFSGRVSPAVGNCEPDAPYSDHFSYLAVLDHKMNFMFEPVKTGVYPSNTQLLPWQIRDTLFLTVLNTYNGIEDISSYIALYNSEGKEVKRRIITFIPEWENYALYGDENRKKLFIIKTNGTIEEIDYELNFIKRKKLIPLSGTSPYKIDVDLDGNDELIFVSGNLDKLIITRNDFSDPAIFNITDENKLLYCTLRLKGEEPPEIYAVCDNFTYIFNYSDNPLYYFKFAVYAGIYLGVFLFILGIEKTQKYRIKQKFETEKKIANLQLKAIKNQVDPHFTLNMINSIGSLIHKKDKEKANYIFGKYSKLIRTTLLSSEKITTTLKEEIDYVKNYLDLEMFRLNDKFEYEIDFENGIEMNIVIPKMLLHTFVENAIKHGIKHLERKGKVTLIAQKEQDNIVIKIKDNGIGRKKTKEYSEFSTGKGLGIINQIIELYFTLEKKKIEYNIRDVKDENNHITGTEVIIIIEK